MQNIGEKIYNLRKQRGVSQDTLAQELKVARFTVSRWETNTAQPTTENIKSLSEFFGVEVNYFFDTADEPAVAKAEPEQQMSQEIKIEPKYKSLKIASAVAGIVLLALIVIACGIAAYVTTKPALGGEWSGSTYTINYDGIIFCVVWVVATAVFITLSVIFIVRFISKRKSNKL